MPKQELAERETNKAQYAVAGTCTQRYAEAGICIRTTRETKRESSKSQLVPWSALSCQFAIGIICDSSMENVVIDIAR